MRIPPHGRVYSINEGNSIHWCPKLSSCIEMLKQDGKYASRYVGSMVADIHRTLLAGGIFMYPSGKNQPDGKLRLLYECNPMAFIVEHAGGRASNGQNTRILDIVPVSIHQRSPVFMGSPEMVILFEQCMSSANS